MAHPLPRPCALALALGPLFASLPAGCFDETPNIPSNTTTGSSSGPASSSGHDDVDVSDTGPSTSSTTLEPATSTTEAVDSASSSGPDDSTASSTASSTTDDDSTTGPSPHVACPAGMLDTGALPSTVLGDSSLQDDELQGSCGGGSAPELAYTFTAPADGSYVLDTGGSDIDTVLYVLDGVCAGPELRCDDDGLAGTNASLTSLSLAAGQTITVVVDAFGVTGGPLSLTVREGSVECPAQSFGGIVPETRLDQTLVAYDGFESSCGTEDEGDQALAFTAPEDGIYRLDTLGSDFDTTLFVLDGTCGGPELACNNDEPGTFGGHSALTVPLAAGQAITAVVEGWFQDAGSFALTVDRLTGTCPDTLLAPQPLPFLVVGSTSATDEASAGSCGGLGSPDRSYTWSAPADGAYRFDTSGSAFDTVVYLLDGGCLGPELICNDDAGGPPAAASTLLTAGQSVVIVVDGAGASGSFQLLVEETTDSGDCCVPHLTPGCEDMPLQICTCTLDDFCCTDEWDGVCVDLALDACGAICL
jgi:hypothetical protein